MKKNMKRSVMIVGFAGLAAIAAGAVYIYERVSPSPPAIAAASPHAGLPAPRMAAALQGFAPGAEIAYNILVPQGHALTGTAKADASGTANVPAYEGSATSGQVTYNLSIRERPQDSPLNLTFRFNPAGGGVSLLGKGFDNFANLRIGEGTAAVQTKADWAGNLTYRGAFGKTGGGGEPGSFQIALFGNDLSGDMAPNPRIIKVFNAPGGGTMKPPASQLNKYTNVYCETLDDGTKVPATCRDAPVAADIQRIVKNYVTALLMVGNEISTMMMKQVEIIGMFIDAKEQLETQQLFQRLTAEAHKDYHPSEMMCRFGSFIKSVPRAEARAVINKQALNSIMMGAYENADSRSNMYGTAGDFEARVRQFRRVYCDPRDNNNGLAYMCEHDQKQDLSNSVPGNPFPDGDGAPNRYDPPPNVPNGAIAPPPPDTRMNKDIDYTRTAGFPLTLDIDFTDSRLTADEEDVVALGRNLYWPTPFESLPGDVMSQKTSLYFDARNIFAMENVAHNSYIQIAAMKARTDPREDVNGLESDSGWNFMKSMMREFGLSDADINKMLGQFPSYYAQMEVLTKKIYENPDFYTNLYDKPANVDRIGVTLDAISLMQQRDQLESRLRQEMLTSLMVEEAINERAGTLNPP